MTNAAEIKATALQEAMRRAALRRNLGTAAILGLAFTGGPFGLLWLATTSTTTFAVLMLWRLRQHQIVP
jgi:hypothetical protein